MRKAVFALVMVAALVGTTAAVSVTARGSFADGYLLLGTWVHTKTDGAEETVDTMVFRMGGKGVSRYERESETSYMQSETEFEWEINDDGKLVIRWQGNDYDVVYDFEIDDAGTKLTLTHQGWASSETTYSKQGSICGVCCPFPFMFVILPAGALLLFRRRKGR